METVLAMQPLEAVRAEPGPWTPAKAAPDGRRGLFALLLGGQDRLGRMLRDGATLRETVPKLMGVSVLAFALHGLVVGATAELLRDRMGSLALGGHPVVWLPAALVAAFVGALGVCLPVFYFCSQVAGLDVPVALVAAQALRGNATGAALLLGLVPFYVAYALGCALQLFGDPAVAVAAGLALPFVVGLWGVRAVWAGFTELAAGLPEGLEGRRAPLLAMLAFAVTVYAAVAPVALWRLAGALGGL